MSDVDMKQKIKEVRDKFLSGNQIEDIRQNITLGVEERLKFLNAEQIKVVELLEKRQQELDSALKSQSQQLSEDKKSIQSGLETRISDLLVQNEHNSKKMETQREQIKFDQKELEKTVEEKLKNALKGQLAFLDDNIAQFATGQAELKQHLESIGKNLSTQVEDQGAELKLLSEKNLSEVESSTIQLTKKAEENEKELFKIINNKLSEFEEEKVKFLKQATETFTKITNNLEEKIASFLQNHTTVEEVIDSRLAEFRTAQKAAFEELEAALNLLERHQDHTLTRFRKKIDATQNRQTNLPNSFVKNRGSILYQSENSPELSLPVVDDAIEPAETEALEKSAKSIFKPLIIAFVASLVFIYVIGYFKLDYTSFLNLSKNLIK
jgi:hypothetical protein